MTDNRKKLSNLLSNVDFTQSTDKLKPRVKQIVEQFYQNYWWDIVKNNNFNFDKLHESKQPIEDILNNIKDQYINDCDVDTKNLNTISLFDAFKSLDTITESYKVNVDDKEKLKDTKQKMKTDTQETDIVIDTEAETEDDLKDDYSNYDILKCLVCNQLVYKKPEDVVLDIDDDTPIYNKEDVCPYCGSVNVGYTLEHEASKPEPESDELETDEVEEPDEQPSNDCSDKTEDELDLVDSSKDDSDDETEELDDDMNEALNSPKYLITDIDNRTFVSLVKTYLNNVYDNVESYNLTNASIDNNKNILLEGTIKFKSGKQINSNFFFKLVQMNEGYYKYIGENNFISKQHKIFNLNARLDNNSLVCESLKYNYKSRIDGNTYNIKGKVSIHG